MSFDINKVVNRLNELGEDWADKNSAADALENTKHSVLSEYKLNSHEKSDAARETEARANPKFKEHIAGMVEARRLANRAKVNYDSARVWAKLLQTKEATKRKEMGLL